MLFYKCTLNFVSWCCPHCTTAFCLKVPTNEKIRYQFTEADLHCCCLIWNSFGLRGPIKAWEELQLYFLDASVFSKYSYSSSSNLWLQCNPEYQLGLSVLQCLVTEILPKTHPTCIQTLDNCQHKNKATETSLQWNMGFLMLPLDWSLLLLKRNLYLCWEYAASRGVSLMFTLHCLTGGTYNVLAIRIN